MPQTNQKKVLSISFLTVKVKLLFTIVSEVLIPVKGRQTEEALNALQDWQRVLDELVTVQDQDVLLVDNYMEIMSFFYTVKCKNKAKCLLDAVEMPLSLLHYHTLYLESSRMFFSNKDCVNQLK